MNRWAWLCALLLVLSYPAVSQATNKYLVIPDLNTLTEYDNLGPVFIQRGDNDNYRHPEFDDSSWVTTRLPFTWQRDLFPGWEGIVWMRMHLILVRPVQGQTIGIELGRIADTDETYLNGYRIGSTGDPANPASHAYQKRRIYTVPTDLIRNGENIVAVKMRPFQANGGGPVSGPFTLGPFRALMERFFFQESILILNSIVLGFVAIFFLIIFFLNREETTNLFFALFLVLLSAYLSLRSDLRFFLPWFDFDSFKRLEYLFQSWLGPVLLLYIFRYFKERGNWFTQVYLILTGLLTAAFFITERLETWKFIDSWLVQPLWLPTCSSILLLLHGRLKTNAEAWILLSTFVLVSLAVAIDLFLTTQWHFNLMLTPWAVLIMVSVLTYTKIYRMIQLRKQSENFSKLLEERVEQRTAELERLNTELETRVSDAVRQIREKDQMVISQARQASLGEIVGNIAHQWRQPLNGLALIIQDLKLAQDYGELDGPYLGGAVSKSQDLIQFMSQTIDDFRQFFKPDSERISFDPVEAVQKALVISEGALKNARITVRTDFETGLQIYGFFNEFSQVILNMLLNAKDAILQSQPKHPWVALKVAKSGFQVLISLEDNGGGIADDLLEKVFDPYFTTKGQTQGTGLGLFMTKTIIEKHMDGQVLAFNGPYGARFEIRLRLSHPGA